MKVKWHRLVFYFAPVDSEASHAFPGLAFHVYLDEADVPFHALPCPRFEAVYRDRLRSGHELLVGALHGDVVFSAWLVNTVLRVDELRWCWHVQHDDVVIYDVITAPRARGKGIYPAALRFVRTLAADRGLRRCWIYAEHGNTASLRGIHKAGFTRYRTRYALQVGKTVLRPNTMSENAP